MHRMEMDIFLVISLGLAVAFMIWVLVRLATETSARQRRDEREVPTRHRSDNEFWE